MKVRSVELGRNWAVVMGLAMLCICMVSGVRANSTNTIPYSESFESLARGALLAGAGGWYGVSNAVEVVEGDPMFIWGYPLSGAHSNALQLTDSVSNLFLVGETDGSGGAPAGEHNPPWVTKETFIDLMVNPVPRDSAPANLDTNVQMAVYLDTDGYLNIYHRYRNAFAIVPDPTGGAEAMWTTLDSIAPIPTGTWFRLTITMAYLGDPWSTSEWPDPQNRYDTWFKVQVNSGAGITSTNGMSVPLTLNNGSTSDGGPWFVTANTGITPAGDLGNSTYWLSSVATEGPGMIDDLVVATDSNALGGADGPYGIDGATYAGAGISNPDGDDDGDGLLNWEELVAGTDPGSPGSVFQVTGQMMMGSSNVVTFMASNMYGLNGDVTMMRTTKPLASVTPGDWVPVGQVPAGQTKFVDLAPPPGTAAYKPVIGWNY